MPFNVRLSALRIFASLLTIGLTGAVLLPTRNAVFAHAASSLTVAATAAPAAIAPGGKGALTITLTIQPGWHVYAADPGSSDYIPTTVAAANAPGITYGKAAFPKPAILKTAVDPKPLNVYESKAVISLPFSVAKSAKPGKHTLSVKIGYQTCNDKMCLPPTTVPVSALVTVK